MPEDVFSVILKEAPSAETIVISGIGEPTAHPDFARYTQLMAHGNMELTSNAYRWDDDALQVIASHYKKVTVSVDGLPSSFLSARGFEFEIMAENVRRLVAMRSAVKKKAPIIQAQLILSTENISDIKGLIPVLKRIGFGKFIISNLLPQTEEDKGKIVYKPYLDKDLRGLVQSWYPVASAHQLPIKIPQTKFNAEHRCNFVEDGALFITAGGDVAPCYRFAHNGREYVFDRKKEVRAVSFGNIQHSSLSEIWQRRVYQVFRFQNYASRCPSCIDCDYVECCDYITTSEADCRANEPSCADCLWCRGLVECP